jgi:hypothetical protein
MIENQSTKIEEIKINSPKNNGYKQTNTKMKITIRDSTQK